MSGALVIGGDGPIGRALRMALEDRGDRTYWTSRRGGALPARAIALNLSEAGIERRTLPEVDVAIICAAMAKFSECRRHPDLARRVNVTAPEALAKNLVARGCHVILLSTSVVLDCAEPQMKAERPLAPQSVYGGMKAEAEARLLALGKNCSVLRLTKVLNPDNELVSGWINELRDGRPVAAFEDLNISPISMSHVMSAIMAVMKDRGGGVYQASGRDDISYADTARHLAKRLGAGEHLVVPARAPSKGIPISEVPPFTSLDTARLTALSGYRPPAALDVLDSVFNLSG